MSGVQPGAGGRGWPEIVTEACGAQGWSAVGAQLLLVSALQHQGCINEGEVCEVVDHMTVIGLDGEGYDVHDLTDEQLQGVLMREVERPIWEMGHVGWFQEYWILRHLDGADAVMKDSDSFYDSSMTYPLERAEFSLPSRSETLEYIATVLDRSIERLRSREPSAEEIYYYLLCIFHEDMHAETLTFIRQTLGYPRPNISTGSNTPMLTAIERDFQFHDVDVPGGVFCLGASPGAPFAFDNEKWGHSVEIEPFSISATPVTNAEFLEFVEADGYHLQGIWGRRGKDWLRRGKAAAPRRHAGSRRRRRCQARRTRPAHPAPDRARPPSRARSCRASATRG